MPKNVISCKFNTNSILKAIKKIKNKNFKKKLYNIKNPYGDGKSGKRIGKFLKNLEIKKIIFKKIYYQVRISKKISDSIELKNLAKSLEKWIKKIKFFTLWVLENQTSTLLTL